MVKNWLVVALVAVNLTLLAVLLFISPGPAPANAQPIAQNGNYLMVTGKIQNDRDAVYVVDLNSRTLHALSFDATTKKLEYRGYRNLFTDFRRPAARTNP